MFSFNLSKFGCLWDLHGERWGRGWEELNKPLRKIDLWGFVWWVHMRAIHAFPAWCFCFSFSSQQQTLWTSCRKVDLITQGNSLVMAVISFVPLLCMLGKQDGSSASRCSAAWATAGCEAQAKAAAHQVSSDCSGCNSSPKWENNPKTVIEKDKPEIA